jgi:hypothetical protein
MAVINKAIQPSSQRAFYYSQKGGRGRGRGLARKGFCGLYLFLVYDATTWQVLDSLILETFRERGSDESIVFLSKNMLKLHSQFYCGATKYYFIVFELPMAPFSNMTTMVLGHFVNLT